MNTLTTFLSAVALSSLSCFANTYTDVIDYTSEDFIESSTMADNIDIYYFLSFSKAGHSLTFSSKNNGIISMSEQVLYLNTIEVEWGDKAAEGQALVFYNQSFSDLSQLYVAANKEDILTTLTCDGANSVSTYNVIDECHDFGMIAEANSANVKSIKFTWGTELATASEPDVVKIDFINGNLIGDKDNAIEGVFYSDEYLSVETSGDTEAILTDKGLTFDGTLTVTGINGYLIEDVMITDCKVTRVDDWQMNVSSNGKTADLSSLSVKMGYELPTETHEKITSFPAEISLEHKGKEARFFYLIDDQPIDTGSQDDITVLSLPEQNPENWIESQDGKVSVDKACTLHCYASTPDHSIKSKIYSVRLANEVTTGIEEVTADKSVEPTEYYSLQGQYLGNDFSKLGCGMYISRNGDIVSKVIK